MFAEVRRASIHFWWLSMSAMLVRILKIPNTTDCTVVRKAGFIAASIQRVYQPAKLMVCF